MRVAVLLTGVSGVGKDTLAAGLIAEHGFRRVAIGDALKDVCCEIASALWRAPVDRTVFDDPERKTRPLELAAAGGLSPNDVLFAVGTRVIRRYLGEDVWARAALNRPEVLAHDRLVCTDIRFPSDLAVAREILGRAGFDVRLVRLVPVEPREALPADAHVYGLPADAELPSSRALGPDELRRRGAAAVLALFSAPSSAEPGAGESPSRVDG